MVLTRQNQRILSVTLSNSLSLVLEKFNLGVKKQLKSGAERSFHISNDSKIGLDEEGCFISQSRIRVRNGQAARHLAASFYGKLAAVWRLLLTTNLLPFNRSRPRQISVDSWDHSPAPLILHSGTIQNTPSHPSTRENNRFHGEHSGPPHRDWTISWDQRYRRSLSGKPAAHHSAALPSEPPWRRDFRPGYRYGSLMLGVVTGR